MSGSRPDAGGEDDCCKHRGSTGFLPPPGSPRRRQRLAATAAAPARSRPSVAILTPHDFILTAQPPRYSGCRRRNSAVCISRFQSSN
jgi:hypothetical protein